MFLRLCSWRVALLVVSTAGVDAWSLSTTTTPPAEVVTGVFVDRALEAEKSQREYQAAWSALGCHVFVVGAFHAACFLYLET